MKALKVAGKILGRILLVLLAAVLLMNIYSIVMKNVFGIKQPSVFGFSNAVVISGSMEPAIHVDDMVIFRRQKSYEIRDIVMCEGESSFVTHRIVGEQDGKYITRGDSNNTDDPPVSPERIVGKAVLIIPGAGKAVSFFQSPAGMCILVLAAFAVLFFPGISSFGKKGRDGEK